MTILQSALLTNITSQRFQNICILAKQGANHGHGEQNKKAKNKKNYMTIYTLYTSTYDLHPHK